MLYTWNYYLKKKKWKILNITPHAGCKVRAHRYTVQRIFHLFLWGDMISFSLDFAFVVCFEIVRRVIRLVPLWNQVLLFTQKGTATCAGLELSLQRLGHVAQTQFSSHVKSSKNRWLYTIKVQNILN